MLAVVGGSSLLLPVPGAANFGAPLRGPGSVDPMPLLTVRLPEGSTLGDALRVLGLTESEADIGYGLILLDPAAELYALRVTDAAATRMSESDTEATVFADPRIEPADPDLST